MELTSSMAPLQRSLEQVKAAARDSIVKTIKQDAVACACGSEAAFEYGIDAGREDVAFEARRSEAIGRGITDFEAARFTTSVEDAFQLASGRACAA